MKRGFSLLLTVFSLLALATTTWAAQGGRAVKLAVDATAAPRKLFRAVETIPAEPGPLTLYYPAWIPGEHGPTGPVVNLSGLKFTAGGQTLRWRRDPLDMYAFQIEVPAGANAVEVSMEFLAPTYAGGFTSGSSTTSHLFVFSWNWLLLYPKVAHTDDLTFEPSIRLPAGWKYATGLDTQSGTGDLVVFKPTSLTMLVDSPVLAGEFFRLVQLSASTPTVQLAIAADSAAALEARPQFLEAMRRLVTQARALFGAEHFERYTFLFTLSDRVAHFGLEHHQSNDTRAPERTLLDESLGRLWLWVLSHEYVHSWNGKHRRPAGLATSDYQKPMRGELLWVYEGLTQYYGNVLAARTGLWTPEEYRDNLASVAASLDNRPGRAWRPLIDTTVAAQLLYGAPQEWEAARRGVDFYDEGWLIWLDADTLIRELTSGKRSLDDFVRRFHGGVSGPPSVKTYTFDDLVSALNEVAPHDWRAFFNERLWSTDARAPLGGVKRGGWRLTYDAARGRHVQDLEESNKRVEMAYSLGLRLNTDGLIADVLPGGAAATAGLGPGMTVVAVDGKAYTPDVLRDAVGAATPRATPLQLLVNNEGALQTFALDYRGGERYPHLTRDVVQLDLLTQTIKPLSIESIGIAECDEFLEKYVECVKSKVPAAAQAAFDSSIAVWRKSWRELAATPAGRAGLTRACKTTHEQARVSLASYGCRW